MPDPLVVGAWSQVARGYASYWGPRFAPFLREALAAFTPGPGPLAVPGCGPGEGACAIAQRWPDRRVVASDPAAPMLALLRERLAGVPLENLDVRSGSAIEVPAHVQEAGGIFSAFVLQLLPDREAALAAWARSLGPKGQVAVVFWPRQPESDAWGHLGRVIQAVTGQPRPDWETPLRARLPDVGLRLREARDLTWPITYASPQEAWEQLRDACSMQVVLQRLGPSAAAQVGEAWVADSGLEREGERWVHHPTARLWLLTPS